MACNNSMEVIILENYIFTLQKGDSSLLVLCHLRAGATMSIRTHEDK